MTARFEKKAVPEEYRLLKDIDFLSEIVYYEKADSTNVRAKEAGNAGAKDRTLYLAEQQDDGRGRRGRSWESPAGGSIYMTLLLRPEIAPVKAPMLTLVMAAAVAAGIEAATGIRAGIKWPNDIVVNGRKVCGILTEMSTEIDHIHYVVIGVGINVNQEEFSEEIKQIATSLKRETGEHFSRGLLIKAIMKKFDEYYSLFMERGDLSGILELYNELLVNRGREVRVLEVGNEYHAHAIGINSEGELLVDTPEGERKHIFAGEVSVRGIYGYV